MAYLLDFLVGTAIFIDMQKPWFRAKKYGLGWVPSTWQGWLVTATYAFIIVGSGMLFTSVSEASPDALGSTFDSDMLILRFVVWIVLLTVVMLWICYKTGEPPKLKWGPK